MNNIIEADFNVEAVTVVAIYRLIFSRYTKIVYYDNLDNRQIELLRCSYEKHCNLVKRLRTKIVETNRWNPKYAEKIFE